MKISESRKEASLSRLETMIFDAGRRAIPSNSLVIRHDLNLQSLQATLLTALQRMSLRTYALGHA